MPVCLRSEPSCHASLKFAGYSNLLNGDILKMSNLKLSQPGVTVTINVSVQQYLNSYVNNAFSGSISFLSGFSGSISFLSGFSGLISFLSGFSGSISFLSGKL